MYVNMMYDRASVEYQQRKKDCKELKQLGSHMGSVTG